MFITKKNVIKNHKQFHIKYLSKKKNMMLSHVGLSYLIVWLYCNYVDQNFCNTLNVYSVGSRQRRDKYIKQFSKSNFYRIAKHAYLKKSPIRPNNKMKLDANKISFLSSEYLKKFNL